MSSRANRQMKRNPRYWLFLDGTPQNPIPETGEQFVRLNDKLCEAQKGFLTLAPLADLNHL